MSVESSGALAILAGIGVGATIGLAIYFAAVGGSAALARSFRTDTPEQLRPLPWLASLTAVLLPMLAPVAAWGISVFVVAKLLHL